MGQLERSFQAGRETRLFEVIAEFDDRDGVEDPRWVEDEMSVLERVNIALDEQEIGTALHRQEAATRDVDTMTCGRCQV